MTDPGLAPALASPWRDHPVPPARLPMVGPDAFIARLAAGAFDSAFPSLPLNQAPPAPESPWIDRPALADALARTNAALGNPLDATTQTAIRTNAVFVIAGQQPGLLLGPMFTLLKAVTAINAARQLQQTTDVPVIPAFWIASEDHDLEEVNRVTLGDHKLVLDHPQLHRPGPRPPVGRVPLHDHRAEIEHFLAHAAADLPHAAFIRQLTADLNLDSYATLFGQLLARLLGHTGLILIDPEHLRPQTAPVLATAAKQWGDIESAFSVGRRNIAAHELTPPLDRVNIFELDTFDRRQPATITTETPGQITTNPERYSPSAALRPLVQDAILPTVATVAGPTELLYLWQIDPLYAAMNLRRSRLLPRLMATVIDTPTRRRARRLNLTEDAAILDVLDRLENTPTPQPEDADLRELDRLAAALTDRLAAIDEPAERKTLTKAVDSIRYRIDRVTRRVHERRLQREGAGRHDLERVAAAVYPHGQLQERALSSLDLLARLGPDLLDNLLRLPLTPIAHHLLSANPPPAGARP